VIKFSRETLARAKYERRGRNLYKPKFPVKDDLLKEPEGHFLGFVRGRLDGRNNYGIYNRNADTSVSSDNASESGNYDYFQPTMPLTPDSDD
jgi:hypothetical protein